MFRSFSELFLFNCEDSWYQAFLIYNQDAEVNVSVVDLSRIQIEFYFDPTDIKFWGLSVTVDILSRVSLKSREFNL